MFKQYFITEKEQTQEVKKEGSNPKKVAKLSPEELLRSNSFKIKLVTPTTFGKQIDFAKKYSDEEIKKVLSDYKIKIKDKSIFIIE